MDRAPFIYIQKHLANVQTAKQQNIMDIVFLREIFFNLFQVFFMHFLTDLTLKAVLKAFYTIFPQTSHQGQWNIWT